MSALNSASLEIQVNTASVRGATLDLRRLERAGADMGQGASKLGQRINKLQKNVDRYRQKLNRLTAGKSGFSEDALKMRQRLNQAKQALYSAERAMDRYSDQVNRAGRSSRNAKKSIATLNNTLGSLRGMVATIGIGILVSHVIQMGTEFDRINNTMLAVFGNTEQATAAFNDMRATAMYLGSDIFALADMYSQMSAASKGTQLEGETTRKIFQSIAETATVLRFNLDQTRGVIKAFEQMISKGTVQAEELRNQLGDRLPGAFNLFVRAQFGAVEANEAMRSSFNDMMRRGELVAAELLPKVADELRRTFGPGLEQARQSAQAEMNRMVSAFRILSLSGWEAGFEEAVINVSKTLRSLFESENLTIIVENTARVVAYLTRVMYDFRQVIVPAAAGLAAFTSIFIGGKFLTALAGFMGMAVGSGGLVGIVAGLAGVATLAATGFGLMGGQAESATDAISSTADEMDRFVPATAASAAVMIPLNEELQRMVDNHLTFQEVTKQAREEMDRVNWAAYAAGAVAAAGAFSAVGRALVSLSTSAAVANGLSASTGIFGTLFNMGKKGAGRAAGIAAPFLSSIGVISTFTGVMERANHRTKRFGSYMIATSKSGGRLNQTFRSMSKFVMGNGIFSSMMRNGLGASKSMGFLAGALATVLSTLRGIVSLLGGPIGIALGAVVGGSAMAINQRNRNNRVQRDADQLVDLHLSENNEVLHATNVDRIEAAVEQQNETTESYTSAFRTLSQAIALNEQQIRAASARKRTALSIQSDINSTDFQRSAAANTIIEADNAIERSEGRISEYNQTLQILRDRLNGVTEAFEEQIEQLRSSDIALEESVLEDIFEQTSRVQEQIRTFGMSDIDARIDGLERLFEVSRGESDTNAIQGLINSLRELEALEFRDSARDVMQELVDSGATGLSDRQSEIQSINRSALEMWDILSRVNQTLGYTREQMDAAVGAWTQRQIDEVNRKFEEMAQSVRNTVMFSGATGMNEFQIFDEQLRQEMDRLTQSVLESTEPTSDARREMLEMLRVYRDFRREEFFKDFDGLTDALERAEDAVREARSGLASIGETDYQKTVREAREETEEIARAMQDARDEAAEQISQGRNQIVVNRELEAVLEALRIQMGLVNQTRDANISQMQRETETVGQLLQAYEAQARAAAMNPLDRQRFEDQETLNDRLAELQARAREEANVGKRIAPFATPEERQSVIDSWNMERANRILNQADDFSSRMAELTAQREALAFRLQQTGDMDAFSQGMARIGREARELRVEFGQGSFADGFLVQLNRMREGVFNFTQEAGAVFGDFFNSFMDKSADAFAAAIVDGERLDKLFQQLSKTILRELISSLIKIGLQYIINHTIGQAMATAATAASVAQASVLAAAWAKPAALASLATAGANSGPAVAGMTATMAAAKGMAAFAQGGFVEGPGTGTSDSIMARLSNGEYVVNARMTKMWLPILEAINAGAKPDAFAQGGSVGTSSARPMPVFNGGGGQTFNVSLEYHGNGDKEDAKEMAKQVKKAVQKEFYAMVAKERRPRGAFSS